METEKILQKKLADMGRTFPGIWKMADRVRSMRGSEIPAWDDAVFLPFDAWQVLTWQLAGITPDEYYASLAISPAAALASTKPLQELMALGAWRPTQDIVTFDPDVYASIADTPLDGDLPADIFWRLPAWCIFFEAPGLETHGKKCIGFFAHLEEKQEKLERELRLLFIAEEGESVAAVVELDVGSLAAALEKFKQENLRIASELFGVKDGKDVSDQDGDALKALHASAGYAYDAGLKTALNLLLYACSYGLADRVQGEKGEFSRPKAKKVKGGWRLFPPDRPRRHVLGESFGREIRLARESASSGGSHSGPRPHIRRAHWHVFRSGPGRSRFLLKWLPPIAVAMKKDEEE